MACGTPVAALSLGAVPEIVSNGVSGIVFGDVDAMVSGLDRVLALDRGGVRSYAERYLSGSRMVDEYIQAYHSILATRLATV